MARKRWVIHAAPPPSKLANSDKPPNEVKTKSFKSGALKAGIVALMIGGAAFFFRGSSSK